MSKPLNAYVYLHGHLSTHSLTLQEFNDCALGKTIGLLTCPAQILPQCISAAQWSTPTPLQVREADAQGGRPLPGLMATDWKRGTSRLRVLTLLFPPSLPLFRAVSQQEVWALSYVHSLAFWVFPCACLVFKNRCNDPDVRDQSQVEVFLPVLLCGGGGGDDWTVPRAV